MIGQAAVETAQAFHEGVAFTGVVLSKLDGDARGGAALSVAEITGEPIMFASTGEKVTDIEVFHPDRMASRILDMGDVLTLIEQAEKAFDKRQADEMARKFLAEEDFTFEDFLQQMNAIKKMGSLKSMLKMMPGMQGMRDQLDAFDDREFDRVEAMVRSMTPFERTHPKQINGSRRARIAKGSGVTVTEVNQLLERFGQAQKMMKSMARGGGGGLPGMPGIPGTGKRGKQQQPQRRKSKSGNPAKRAAEERAAAEKAGSGRAASAASAFGAPGARRCRRGPTTSTRWPASTPLTCPRASRSSSARADLRHGRSVPSGTHPSRRLRAPASRVTMVVGQGDHSTPRRRWPSMTTTTDRTRSRDSGQPRPVASAADPEEEADWVIPVVVGAVGFGAGVAVGSNRRGGVHLVEAELTVGTSTFPVVGRPPTCAAVPGRALRHTSAWLGLPRAPPSTPWSRRGSIAEPTRAGPPDGHGRRLGSEP